MSADMHGGVQHLVRLCSCLWSGGAGTRGEDNVLEDLCDETVLTFNGNLVSVA